MRYLTTLLKNIPMILVVGTGKIVLGYRLILLCVITSTGGSRLIVGLRVRRYIGAERIGNMEITSSSRPLASKGLGNLFPVVPRRYWSRALVTWIVLILRVGRK